MATREHLVPYVTSRTFADPTAWEGIRNAQRSSYSPPMDKQTPSDLVEHITTLSDKLRELNQRRKLREITRREYAEQRTPLVTDYHAILQAHLAGIGGK